VNPAIPLAASSSSASLLTIAAHGRAGSTQNRAAAPKRYRSRCLSHARLFPTVRSRLVFPSPSEPAWILPTGALTRPICSHGPCRQCDPASHEFGRKTLERGTHVNLRGLGHGQCAACADGLSTDAIPPKPRPLLHRLHRSFATIARTARRPRRTARRATYGSDAIAVVINIILKRGLYGAVTRCATPRRGRQTLLQPSQLWPLLGWRRHHAVL